MWTIIIHLLRPTVDNMSSMKIYSNVWPTVDLLLFFYNFSFHALYWPKIIADHFIIANCFSWIIKNRKPITDNKDKLSLLIRFCLTFHIFLCHFSVKQYFLIISLCRFQYVQWFHRLKVLHILVSREHFVSHCFLQNEK